MLRGLERLEVDLKILAEDALHDIGFVFAQEPIVDEDAGELVPNRLVQQSRCDRRIDAATQAEYDLFVAHLLPHPLAGFVDEGSHRPIHRALADAEEKILNDLFSPRRVRDLRGKLQREELAFVVFDRGKGGILRVCDGVESLRERSQFVAVAAPDVHLFAEPVEEASAPIDVQTSGPILAPGTKLDLAAKMAGHQLHAIADAEDGDA